MKSDLESTSNYWAVSTCSWIIRHGEEPRRRDAASEEEISCAGWLSYNRRKWKGHRGNYPSDLEILRKYGLGDLFFKSYRELTSNQATSRICEAVVSTGIEPAAGSPDGEWLKRRRLGRCRVYRSDLEIAVKSGLPNIFSRVPQEMRSNINTHMACRWVIENQKDPSPHSEDHKERYLGVWLVNRRQAAKGQNTAKFYQSDAVIAQSYGVGELFGQTQ